MMPLRAGTAVERDERYSLDDFRRFALLSGDDNPIHVDPDFAARTRFRRPVAHGMFLYARLCALVGRQLPGSRQLTHQMTFYSPTYAGESVTLRLHVESYAEGIVTLATSITRADGAQGLVGHCRVSLPDGPDVPPVPAPSPESGTVAEFDDLRVGQQASLRRTFTAADLDEYMALTGDDNVLYTDPACARRHGLDGLPLPGPLLGTLFSRLLGTELPGPGTNWLKQHFAFPATAHLGESLSARVEVVRIRPEKALVNLKTTCVDQDGVVAAGGALVLVKDRRIGA